jgi:hypothetical protein
MQIINFLKSWLTTPIIEGKSKRQERVWLGLSLLICLIYALQTLIPLFQHKYIVQDDARQHLFWTARFLDPELFPKDIIADFYHNSAPLGYTALYKLIGALGFNPVFVGHLLPIVLGFIATYYAFTVSLQLFPIPAAAFINTLLFNQFFWGIALLAGATPRAFLFPFLFMLLHYLLKGSLGPCLVAIALQGLFYPPVVLISAGILIIRLLRWKQGLPRLVIDRNNLPISLAGLGMVVLTLLPEVLGPSPFGPIITPAVAKTMPEFLPGGRTAFFGGTFWDFWFNAQRSGLGSLVLVPPILYVALLVPILSKFPRTFPLTKLITPKVSVIVQLVAVSVGLFLLAHAVLLKLYLPSRYTVGIVCGIRFLTGIGIVLLLDSIFCFYEQSKRFSIKGLGLFSLIYFGAFIIYWLSFSANIPIKRVLLWLVLGLAFIIVSLVLDKLRPNPSGKSVLAVGVAATILGLLLGYPSWVRFPDPDYFIGTYTNVYEYLAKQPKDTLIASLTFETDHLPTFSKRSILVGREYALPYQVGYYKVIRERIGDLINAQYSGDLGEVKAFIKKYGVDYWLIQEDAFSADYFNKPSSWEARLTSAWLKQYSPETPKAIAALEKGTTPALAKTLSTCTVLKERDYLLLDAKCIVNGLPHQ